VLQTAEEFDLVWHCKLRTPNMFPCWQWPRSVVDIDDVPSTFERAVLDSDPSKSKRLANWVRFLSWRQRDRRLGERFTVLGVCSEEDRRYLKGLGVDAPVHVIPNGFDRPSTVPVRTVATPPRIGFVGIFDYWPNRSGIEWFVSRCWPGIKEQVPMARLRLVGRYSDGPLKPAGQDIDGLGWVSDIAEEISTWSAMVVPVHVGGGTRGKIALAFSQKCPVVSTTLGACGYESRDQEIAYLADSAEAFSDACLRAIREPAEAAAIAERAWRQFLEKWTWDAIRPSVLAAAEQCLQMSEVGAARHGVDG
jgi:glycosyltransferase involved in cell wall biosynthesis